MLLTMGRALPRSLRRKGQNYTSSGSKKVINNFWAQRLNKHRKIHNKNKVSKVLILDAKTMYTSKSLVEVGISKKNIYAPNVNPDVVNALKKYGVNSTLNTMENYLRRSQTMFSYLWYDGMSTLHGNAYGHHPCVAVDTWLRRGLAGSNCLVGVTIASRCNNLSVNVKPQAEMLKQQMEAIFSCHGRLSKQIYLDSYKKGMIFGMWELSKGEIVKKEFLRVKNSDQLIGFPKTYNTRHLV